MTSRSTTIRCPGRLDPSPEQMRRVWAHYLGNVTLIDEKVGAAPGFARRSAATSTMPW